MEEMNHCGSADNRYCYFHPRDAVVGVCAACLKERLLVLAAASKQEGRVPTKCKGADQIIRRSCRSAAFRRRRSSGGGAVSSLPKVFAFLHRLDSRRHRPDHHHDDDDDDDPEESIASLEDSFISIKFEDNGNARWDNKKPPPPPPPAAMIRPANSSNDGGGGRTTSSSSRGKEEIKEGIRSIVYHAKKGGVLRWRKRIGHLLQLALWKRSGKAAAGHAGLGSSAKTEASGAKGRQSRVLDKDPNNQDQDQDQDQDHHHHYGHRYHHHHRKCHDHY